MALDGSTPGNQASVHRNIYQPMLELLAYLRANGFKTFIVSGGGVARGPGSSLGAPMNGEHFSN